MLKYFGIFAFIIMSAVSVFAFTSGKSTLVYERPNALENIINDDGEILTEEPSAIIEKDFRPIVSHVPLPKQVKAIYMTSCVVGTPSFREKLVNLIKETELNSLVIDIKDYSGTLSFNPENENWKSAWQASKCGARDMREFLASLHEAGIYTIGRITVFQDPFYSEKHTADAVKRADGVTVWRDYKGLSFIDVGAKNYWEHLLDLVVDSYNIGFDELNFDYVRYPSDGNMQDISFTHAHNSEWGSDKQANLEAFFAYLFEEINDETNFADYKHENTGREKNIPFTSVDLFGMTTTNFDDLSIGQVIERAAPYFDFIAPMVYPSHYPNNFLGLGNPNNHPYEIVYHAMVSGVNRLLATSTPVAGFLHERIGTSTPAVYKKPVFPASHLRTWIQDFDYGGNYDIAEVRAEIQASYDAGVMDFMIWAPSNIYTKGALKAPNTYEVENTNTINLEGISEIVNEDKQEEKPKNNQD